MVSAKKQEGKEKKQMELSENGVKLLPLVLSATEAYQHLMNGAVMLDVRMDFDKQYRSFDVPEVYEKEEDIPKNRLLVIADESGTRGGEIARRLLLEGYEKVAYLSNGVLGWDKNNLPLIKNKNYELSGSCACRLGNKGEK